MDKGKVAPPTESGLVEKIRELKAMSPADLEKFVRSELVQPDIATDGKKGAAMHQSFTLPPLLDPMVAVFTEFLRRWLSKWSV